MVILPEEYGLDQHVRFGLLVVVSTPASQAMSNLFDHGTRSFASFFLSFFFPLSNEAILHLGNTRTAIPYRNTAIPYRTGIAGGNPRCQPPWK